MTKEELETIVPYIMEMRRRERQVEIKLLQQITNDEEDYSKSERFEDETRENRLQQIKVC